MEFHTLDARMGRRITFGTGSDAKSWPPGYWQLGLGALFLLGTLGTGSDGKSWQPSNWQLGLPPGNILNFSFFVATFSVHRFYPPSLPKNNVEEHIQIPSWDLFETLLFRHCFGGMGGRPILLWEGGVAGTHEQN